MKHTLLALPVLCLSVLCLPVSALAGPSDAVLSEVVKQHILPRFETLAQQAGNLGRTAAQDCNPESQALRVAYGDAFDAWIAASHLRFGPTERKDRAYALAFWPDTRGITPRTLAGLIADADPVARNADDYAQVSIAARGFYAMEFLLYDPATRNLGQTAYRCTLMRAVAMDIANVSQEILDDWQGGYADLLTDPSADGPYRNEDEAMQELFKALSTGLQFTSDTRLGRPLGTFERPRPKRAEAWRSGRSARHVALSLASLRDLALRLAGDDAALAGRLEQAFQRAQDKLESLDDPVFAGVANPQARIRVEAVQVLIDKIRDIVRTELGPRLGVAAGFNAMDGD